VCNRMVHSQLSAHPQEQAEQATEVARHLPAPRVYQFSDQFGKFSCDAGMLVVSKWRPWMARSTSRIAIDVKV
jgi:hypothetical protein